MLNFCAVKNCGSRGKRVRHVPNFRIPKVKRNKSKEKRELKGQQQLKCLANIGRADIGIENIGNYRVCSLHFINRDDDPNVLRVEMSCGHAVDPSSLTGWCRSLIDRGHSTFQCPAAKDGTEEKCNKEWPYVEVRRHALLTDKEQKYFEEKVALLAASKYCEFSMCPGCQTCVERKDLTNLSVRCSICTAQNGKCYEFCWQCSKQWKGRAPRSDRCDNEGCTNIQLDTLKNCDMKTLSYSYIQCPKIRACPTCGITIEHKDKCKYILCSRCHVEFCFACLKTKAVCEISSNYSATCANPVAPRQTSIPTWTRTPNTSILEMNHLMNLLSEITYDDDDVEDDDDYNADDDDDVEDDDNHHDADDDGDVEDDDNHHDDDHSTNNENSSCTIL